MKRCFFQVLVLSVLFVIFGVFDLIGQSSDDHSACKFARKDSNVETWKYYLENFPNGECALEARAALHEAVATLQRDFESKDQTACNKARQQNTFEGWDQYLKNFPNGKCNFEAKVNMKKKGGGIKIGNLIWSDRSSSNMNWQSAINYCQNLNEGGHSDWRLPTISELKTTIQNCHSGGSSCRVSDTCVSIISCYSRENCRCDRRINNGGYYSRLGDTDGVWLWSSITTMEAKQRKLGYSDAAWGVDFLYGDLDAGDKLMNFYVRCVR